MASKAPVPGQPKIWLLPPNETEQSIQLSGTTDVSTGNDYCAMLEASKCTKTADLPTEDEHGSGALRPGGALNLFSAEAFGLLSQYAGVGILLGVFNALIYPLFQNYLHMEGYQSQSYKVLISLGWASKIFFGILTDCLPIFGYKRRPYMVLGWAICGLCCLIMAITKFPDPYNGKPGLRGLNNLTAEQLKYINDDAPTSVDLFIVLSMIASLGFVMADVAADAMVVQYAQREPIAIRGRIQTAIYFTRDTFMMVPMLVVGFCMNDYKYGGPFSWSIGPNALYAGLTIPCLVGVYAAFALIVEEKAVSMTFRQYLHDLWELLQLRVVWQICAFKFFNLIFGSYISTLADPISSIWVHVQPLVATSFAIVAQFVRVVVMFIIGKYALSWDWRTNHDGHFNCHLGRHGHIYPYRRDFTMAISTVILVVMDTFIRTVAIWDVYRNQYFQNVTIALESIPNAFLFLFGTYVIVEIVQIGNEGTVYALVGSISNLASPLSIVSAKLVDSLWSATLKDIQRDDSTVRWQVTYAFICAACFKLFSLAFLFLMPRQKAYVHLLRRTGGSSPIAGCLVVAIFTFGYVFNLVSNILSIFKSTSCLRIAGGKGC
ncbi:hypothetical protein LEN26_013463 [Aphanomyces euteiches]|nr:hypothetical protein LEN26_013463 [Aphanomyces euteiches]